MKFKLNPLSKNGLSIAENSPVLLSTTTTSSNDTDTPLRYRYWLDENGVTWQSWVDSNGNFNTLSLAGGSFDFVDGSEFQFIDTTYFDFIT